VRLILRLLLTALVASSVVASSGTALALSSLVLYVSPHGDDAGGSGTRRAPFATIAHALTVAPPGSTIVLEPGVYPTMVTIDWPVTLESDASYANAMATTVIDGTGRPNGVWIHGQAAAGAVVRGVTVENANDQGILVEDVADVTIEDTVVTSNALHPRPAPSDYRIMPEDKAIQLVGTRRAMVQHNIVTANRHGGIAVLDSPTNPAVGNIVSKNRVANNQGDCGIVVAAYVSGKGVSDNVVEGNTVVGNVAGIVVAADPPGTAATDNVVRGNVIVGNRLPGVIVHSNARDQVVSGTFVSENTIRDNGSFPGIHLNESAGIAIVGAVAPVTNTIVRNNRISDEAIPVWRFDPTARPLFSVGAVPPWVGVSAILLISICAAVAAELTSAPAPSKSAARNQQVSSRSRG
jgi:hypothetical protein